MSLDSPPPLTILIIRHAEKPAEIWPGPGLSPEGKEDEKSLVIRGWERAGAWGALFGTQLGVESYPKPSAIYAASPEAVYPQKLRGRFTSSGHVCCLAIRQLC
jgi:hypothetical protein